MKYIIGVMTILLVIITLVQGQGKLLKVEQGVTTIAKVFIIIIKLIIVGLFIIRVIIINTIIIIIVGFD